MTPWAQRPLGLRLIIVYKFTKAPLMLGLALWLTAAPGSTYRFVEEYARELAEGGATWAHAAAWIEANFTPGVIAGGAVLAWLDCLSTAAEGILLLSGKSWAEWIVIVGLASLLPVEIVSLESRPGVGKLIILAVNAVIVIYLARKRVLATRATSSGR